MGKGENLYIELEGSYWVWGGLGSSGFNGVRTEDTWDLSSRFGHVLTWVPSQMGGGSEKSLV